MVNRKLVDFDEEARHIDDDDGGTDSDFDVCDACGCVRAVHDGGDGQCSYCERCNTFRDS